MPEKLYTKKEVAALLQCSIGTIHRRIKAGELHVIRNGRFVRITESELKRFLYADTESNSDSKKHVPLPDSWK